MWFRRAARVPVLIAALCFILASGEWSIAAQQVLAGANRVAMPWELLAEAWLRLMMLHLLVWSPVVALLSWPLRSRWKVLGVILVPIAGLASSLATNGLFGVVLSDRARAAAVLVVAVLAAAAWCLLARILAKRSWPRRVLNLVAGLAAILVLCCVGIGRGPMLDPWSVDELSIGPLDSAQGGRDVIFIVLDTVRADALAPWGGAPEDSPQLAKLAQKCLVADRSIGTGIWTVPNHGAFFTGAAVKRLGLDLERHHLDPSFETIAERLGERGWRTAAFVSNPWLADEYGYLQGFDQVWDGWRGRRFGRSMIDTLFQRFGMTPPWAWLDFDFGAGRTNAVFANWLEPLDQQPIFAFVHFMEAHGPYRIPRPWRQRYLSDAGVDRSYDLRQRAHGDLVELLHRRYTLGGAAELDESDREILRQQYRATIRYLDDRLGQLLDLLASSGRLEDALLVIATDHGEYLGDHGFWTHGDLVFNSVSHSALMVCGDGIEPGRELAVAQTSDVFATILAATLGESPPFPESLDLLAGLPPERHALTAFPGPMPAVRLEYHRSAESDYDRMLSLPWSSLQGPRFKLARSASGDLQLYDLDEDPGELHDVQADFPEELERLEALLDATLAAMPEGPGGEAPELDERQRQQLRAVGYLD